MTIRLNSKVLCLFILATVLTLLADVLDLGRKSVYNLGEGESLSLKLDFPKGGQYEFNSANASPFSLKKISSNKIEITFEADKLNAKPTEKQLYQAAFGFIKVNTGRKSTLIVKATYIPPVTTTVKNASATPTAAKSGTDPVAQASKQVQQTSAEMQKVAAKAQQVAQSVGMEPAPVVDTLVKAIPAIPETIRVMVPAAPVAPPEAPFPWLWLAIVVVLLIVVIVLVIKQMVPKHAPVSDKYEQFYSNVAAILDINIKGRSIDNCSEEIVHALMDLVQTEDHHIALVKNQNGIEKLAISKTVSRDDDDKIDPAMSSQFIDPSYNTAFNNNFESNNSGSGTLKTKNPQFGKTIIRAYENQEAKNLSYDNPADYLEEASTMSFNPKMMDKIHGEINAESGNATQQIIEEKSRKINDFLGKKKYE